LRWNYDIRITNNAIVTLADERVLAVDTLGVPSGGRRYFQNVRLTAEADWGCNLAVPWTRATPKQPAELCAIAMNQTGCTTNLEGLLEANAHQAKFPR
jgi:hypothetical protein